MATTNVTRPSGFKPLRYLSGADWNGQSQTYAFSSSNSAACYKYDLVIFDSSNRTAPLTDWMPALPFVASAAADVTTAAQRGVVVGFLPEPEFSMSGTASLGLMYRVGSTNRWANVVDDPSVIFEAEEEAGGYTSASNNFIGKAIGTDYVAGSTTTGVSKATIKSSDSQTAAARPFKVLRFVPRPDNFGFAAADNPTYAKYEILPFNFDLNLAYAAATSASATLVIGA